MYLWAIFSTEIINMLLLLLYLWELMQWVVVFSSIPTIIITFKDLQIYERVLSLHSWYSYHGFDDNINTFIFLNVIEINT